MVEEAPVRVKTTTSDDAVIAAGARVIGEIVAREPLRVAGRVVGAVDVRGSVRVERGGLVRGRVSASRLEIEGVVVGEITAQGTVAVGPRAQVVGSLSADRLAVERGAALAIDVDVRVEGLAADTPPRAARAATSGLEPRARPAGPRGAAAKDAVEAVPPPVARPPTAHPPTAHPPTAHPPTAHPPAAHPPSVAPEPRVAPPTLTPDGVVRAPPVEAPASVEAPEPPPLRARYVVHARRREGVTLAPGDDALHVTERPRATEVEAPRREGPPPAHAPEGVDLAPEQRPARRRVVERRRADGEALPVPIEASMMGPADDAPGVARDAVSGLERDAPSAAAWPEAASADAQPKAEPSRGWPTTFSMGQQLAAQTPPASRASEAPRPSLSPTWTVRRTREEDGDGGAPSKRLRLRPRKRGDT